MKRPNRIGIFGTGVKYFWRKKFYGVLKKTKSEEYFRQKSKKHLGRAFGKLSLKCHGMLKLGLQRDPKLEILAVSKPKLIKPGSRFFIAKKSIIIYRSL